MSGELKRVVQNSNRGIKAFRRDLINKVCTIDPLIHIQLTEYFISLFCIIYAIEIINNIQDIFRSIKIFEEAQQVQTLKPCSEIGPNKL